MILGIDPGQHQSGWCELDRVKGKYVVLGSGVIANSELLYNLALRDARSCTLALEVFEARGMPIGEDSIETILFTGRVMQVWTGELRRVRRSKIKLHLCGTSRAKDPNVRRVLIDKIGVPGTRKNPGPTFGVTSHAWAALACAVTALETSE